MREQEQKIINLIGKLDPKPLYEQVYQIIEEVSALKAEPQAITQEFLNDPLVLAFIRSHKDQPSLWYFLPPDVLQEIEQKLKSSKEKYQIKRKAGVPFANKYWYEQLRDVYLSGNSALIDIYKKYLPIPSVEQFQDQEIPQEVTAHQAQIEQSLHTFINRNKKNSLKELTDKVIKIQRHLRSKLRQQEEISRIASRESWQRWYLKKNTPLEKIKDANRPYRPQCANKDLATRIMEQAKQVRLFSTVKHWTGAHYIKNIFNDNLYGRHHLVQSGIPFVGASFRQSCDLDEGDGNVICLAGADIDPKAKGRDKIELVFDLDKISAINPNIFFKQKDFHYRPDGRNRKVVINPRTSKMLLFSQTGYDRCHYSGFSQLEISYNNSYGYFVLPNYSLISYNVKEIHQILTLNFFRFLDHMDIDDDGEPIKNPLKEKIYGELDSLSDAQLLEFLKTMGQQVSDTCEFNIYSAHQIDFSTLINLNYCYYSESQAQEKIYSLNIQELIDSLNQDNMTKLKDLQQHLPDVLASYRFLDYLLSKTTSIAGHRELTELYAKCKMDNRKSFN